MTRYYGTGRLGFSTPDHGARPATVGMPWTLKSQVGPGVSEEDSP